MKKIMKHGILMMSGLLLAACGNNDAGTGEGTEEETTRDDDTIILYSNAVSDGRGDYFKEKAEEAGFNIEIVDLGGADLLNRILAEKDAPVADIIFGLNDMNFQTLRDEEILEPYAPVWLDEIADDVEITEDNLYSPVTLARVFPIYNADLLSADEAPTNYEDLYQNEEFHNRYRVQNEISGATDTAAMYTQLIKYRDDNGDMGVSQEGWDNLTAFFDNGYKTPEGEDWVQNLVSGDVPVAYTWMANVLFIEDEYDISVGVVNPDDGVVQTVEQVGIVADGEDNELEQEFIDWFGSEEIMRGFAEEHNQMPANEAARDGATDRLLEIMDQTEPQEIDFEWVQEHLDEWVEYVELNLM